MAMPDKETIRGYFMEGKWTERMLRTAQVCKALTAEEVDTMIAEKAAMESASTAASN